MTDLPTERPDAALNRPSPMQVDEPTARQHPARPTAQRALLAPHPRRSARLPHNGAPPLAWRHAPPRSRGGSAPHRTSAAAPDPPALRREPPRALAEGAGRAARTDGPGGQRGSRRPASERRESMRFWLLSASAEEAANRKIRGCWRRAPVRAAAVERQREAGPAAGARARGRPLRAAPSEPRTSPHRVWGGRGCRFPPPLLRERCGMIMPRLKE